MTPRHLATEPIVEPDDTVETALRTANILAVVASVVHITGDPAVLRGPIRPGRPAFNELDGGLAAEEQAELRKLALGAVSAFRDRGSEFPPPLEGSVVRELMDWLAGAHVDDDYAELFREEMDLGGSDPRRIEVQSATPPSVLVIGCGMSGLLAGIRLKEAGIPFEIVEKNDDVGGTWYENTYPGCRVDVANHYYCYSFEPNHGFSEYYSPQPELHTYFRDVMYRQGIDRHVRWRTEVERAAWEEDGQFWRITIRATDGRRSEMTADAIISAVGQLNRPHVPDIPNLDHFAGPVFHSAQWDSSVELRGKRVALIGAGASGFQIGPAIVDDVESLIVFQRTAQWMMPNRLYHEPVSAGSRWAMRHLPGYSRWYRFLLLLQATDRMLDVARVDPSWPGLPGSVNARNDRFRQTLVQWIEGQIGDRPELMAKVVPDYPPLGKRLLQDDGSWLRCLCREHVELVREQITDIEADAVVTADRRYPADVIVLATGFRANDFLFPIEIVGRGGRSLHDFWDGRPAAYLGITLPDFPNLFLMFGPGTNLAHAGSVIFQSECQMRYVGACLAVLAQNGGGSVEPTTAAFDDYVQRWQDELSQTVWAHPSVRHSWYKAADGCVYVLSPWRLVDYWKMTATPDPAAHQVDPPRAAL